MKRKEHGVTALCVVFAVTLFFGMVSGAMAQESAGDSLADGVVAFYFHGNVRCATCKKIESYAVEAVHSGFPEALEDGVLAWRVVNVDDEENKHFIQDFQLVTRSVVLAEFRDGEVVRWRNLDKVWQLVRDKERFVGYVQDGTKAFLENG
jgi:hypothetical protein